MSLQLLAHGSAPDSPLQWSPRVDTWVVIGALALGYVLYARRAGGLSAGKAAWFLSGLLLLWVATDWPIDPISENYLLSVHMVQFLLLALVAPPMLILGMPRATLRRFLSWPPLRRLVGQLTRPLIAALIFNGVLVLSHWPVVVDAYLSSDLVHAVMHVVWVGSGLLMWWPALGPLPELPRLPEPANILYLFLQSIIPTVPASFLTFANEPLYQTYADFPRAFGISATTDQMLAGLTMKIAGGLFLWAAIAVLFFRWHAREEASEAEAVPWEEFEEELEVWELRR